MNGRVKRVHYKKKNFCLRWRNSETLAYEFGCVIDNKGNLPDQQIGFICTPIFVVY